MQGEEPRQGVRCQGGRKQQELSLTHEKQDFCSQEEASQCGQCGPLGERSERRKLTDAGNLNYCDLQISQMNKTKQK